MVTADEFFFGTETQTIPDDRINNAIKTQQTADEFFGISNSTQQAVDLVKADNNMVNNADDFFGVKGSRTYDPGFWGTMKSHYKLGKELTDTEQAADKIMLKSFVSEVKDEDQLYANLISKRKELQDAYPMGDADRFGEKTMYAIAQMANPMIESKLQGAAFGLPAGLATAGIATMATVGPDPTDLATGPVAFYQGYKTGSKIGEINYWRSQGAGGILLDLIEEGVDKKYAKPLAQIGGLVYGYIEQDVVGKMMGKNPITKGASRKFIKNALLTTLKNYALRVGEETAEEALQEIVVETTKKFAEYIDPNKKNPKLWESIGDIGLKAGQAAKESISPLGVLSIIGLPGDIKNMRDSRADIQGNTVIDENVAEQKIQAIDNPQQMNQEQVIRPIDQILETEPTQEELQPDAEDFFTLEETQAELKPNEKAQIQADLYKGLVESKDLGNKELENYTEEDMLGAIMEVSKTDQTLLEAKANMDVWFERQQAVANMEMQQEIEKEQKSMNLEADPIAAFSQALPKISQYAGRGAMREVNKPIYVQATKDGKLPGEYEGLNRVKGTGIRFTTDPQKGVALDDVLDEFNNNNPGLAMDENEFRDMLRSKQQEVMQPTQQTAIERIQQIPQETVNQFQDRLDNMRQKINQARQQVVNRGGTKAAHDMGLIDIETNINNLQQMQDLGQDDAPMVDRILKQADNFLEQQENKEAVRQQPKAPSWRKLAEQHGIQLNSSLSSTIDKLDNIDNNEIPEAPTQEDRENIQYLYAGMPLMSEEKSLEMTEKLKEASQGFSNKWGNFFDVIGRFRKINALDTGYAIKDQGSMDVSGEKRAIITTKKLREIFKNRAEYEAMKTRLLFVAEGSVEAETELEKEYARRYKEEMDYYAEVLKKNGVLPQKYQDKIREQVEAELISIESKLNAWFITEDNKKQLRLEKEKLVQLKKDLKNYNFTPLGSAVNLAMQRKIDESREKGESITTFFDKGNRNFAGFRQTSGRKTIFAKDLYDAGLLTDEDIDPTRQAAVYIKYIYGQIGQLNIAKAAAKDGLMNKAKLKTDWVELPIKVNGEAYYADPVFATYINDMLAAQYNMSGNVIYQGWRKLTAFIKLRQFWNPGYLGYMDFIQAFQNGIYFDKNIGSHIKEAANLMKTKPDLYFQLIEKGLLSTPDTNPLASFQSKYDSVMDYHKSDTNSKLVNSMHSAMAKALGIMKKTAKSAGESRGLSVPMDMFNAMEEVYSASWDIAWQGDEFFRLVTATKLMSDGYTLEDAAREAATIHGDYAGVPVTTRKLLNLGFFTPTFQIAMFKWYANLAKSFAKAITKDFNNTKAKMLGGETVALSSQERLKANRAYTAMASLIGLVFGKHMLISKYAERTETFSRRYIFKSKDGKDAVVVFATPFNVPMRLWERFIQPYFDPSLSTINKVKKSVAGISGYLNPLLVIPAQWGMNRRDDGLEIYNQFDDPKDQIFDTAVWFFDKFYPLVKTVADKVRGEQLYGTDIANKKVIDDAENALVLQIINKLGLAFIYAKDVSKVQAYRETSRLWYRYESAWQDGILSGDPRIKERAEARKRNFMKQIKDIKKKHNPDLKKEFTGGADLPASFWDWFATTMDM